MARIFISHASSDKKFVEAFVDTIVRLGCGAGPKSFFYSSGDDTGVPSGVDLNAYIRNEFKDVKLVVALITPAFLMRPYCLAELGAAWSQAGRLFPLTAGMPSGGLEGVLEGLVARDVGQAKALDELHQRISEALGVSTEPATWGSYRDQWLGRLEQHLGGLAAIRANDVTSVTSCSRDKGHMEVFWTDASGSVWYRRWEGYSGWSDEQKMTQVKADYVAAVSPREDETEFGEMLFGVRGTGRVWVRRWVKNQNGAWRPAKKEWIKGKVTGPLTAVSRERDVELIAWTPKGEQCHLWREGEGWTDWETGWQ